MQSVKATQVSWSVSSLFRAYNQHVPLWWAGKRPKVSYFVKEKRSPFRHYIMARDSSSTCRYMTQYIQWTTMTFWRCSFDYAHHKQSQFSFLSSNLRTHIKRSDSNLTLKTEGKVATSSAQICKTSSALKVIDHSWKWSKANWGRNKTWKACDVLMLPPQLTKCSFT